MFFAALFAMYFTLRAVNPGVSRGKELLNIPFASINTTILVLSSVTCQLGVFAAERGDVKGLRRWFITTFLMGSVFIGGQVWEYAELVHEGLTLSSSAGPRSTSPPASTVCTSPVALSPSCILATTYVAKRFAIKRRAIVVLLLALRRVVWIALFFMIYVLQ